MPLDKAIQHKKEHRKPYYGSKAIDRTCRNHGTCGVCQGNRFYKTIKRSQAQLDKLREFKVGDKVRVKSKEYLFEHRDDTPTVVEKMFQYADGVFEIESIYSDLEITLRGVYDDIEI